MMTESLWLASEDPAALLQHLKGKISQRKLRLWCCACAIASGRDFGAAYDHWATDGQHDSGDGDDEFDFAVFESWTEMSDGEQDSLAARAHLLRDIAGNPFRPVRLPFKTETHDTKLQAAVASSSVPNFAIYATCRCPWLTPQVVNVAQTIYDTGDFTDLPILWDALEEAGCTNEEVQKHCQGLERCPGCCGNGHIVEDVHIPDSPYIRSMMPRFERQERLHLDCHMTGWTVARGPHVRGCWLIDLLLGKE